MIGADSFLDGWRSAIGQQFFRPDQADQNVALCVDSELLRRIAAQLNLDDLIESIEDECRLLLPRRRNPLDLALDQLVAWDRNRRAGYPPYLPILAFLVAAASYNQSDAADHAYWSRVERLREERIGHVEPLSANKRVVELMFRDLARWASSENQGRLGRFDFRRFGRLRYVGLIRAQSILSPADVRALHRSFAESEFSAIKLPARVELLQAALRVRDQLRPTLTRLLEQWPADALAEAALDRIEDVLEAWDGSLIGADNICKNRRALPVVLELRPAGRDGLRSFLRVASGADGVPDELILETATGRKMLARFDAGELSQPLEDVEDEQRIDAASVDWATGIRFTTQNSATISAARLPGRTLRFFVLQGRAWIEASMFPSHAACLVALSDGHAATVVEWLGRAGSHQPYSVVDAAPIPSGWRLLRLERTLADNARSGFPLPGLLVSDSPMIRIFGGVRTGQKAFLPYALPQVEVEGVGPDVQVQLADVFDTHGHKLRGVRLVRRDETSFHEIVADEAVWGDLAGIRIEAVDARNEVQASKTIVVGEVGPAEDRSGARDKWGRLGTVDESYVWGLTFSGPVVPALPTVPISRPLPTTVSSSAADTFLRILATRSSISWPTASLTARSIAESDGRQLDWNASRSVSLQFEGMRMVGALEIQEDAAGRFADVCRLRPFLHLMPSRAPIAGKFPFHAVFSGTYSVRLRDRLLQAAEERSIRTHVQHQPTGCWLIPDCISLFADYVESFEAVAKDVECAFISVPFAAAIANWLEPPTHFVEVAPWRAGPAPHAQSRLAFCPQQLRLRAESEVMGRLAFFECREPYAEHLWSYWLYDRDLDRHCQCPRQLGRWIAFLSRPSPPLGLPTSATGELYLPIELRPPLLVERAICACSGLTPALVTFPPGMRHLSDLGYPEPPTRPSEWFRASSRVYSGHWLRYERVRNSPLVSTDAQRPILTSLALPVAQVPIAHLSNLDFDHG